MTETTKKRKSRGTLTRCTQHAQQEITSLSKRLYTMYTREHNQLGIKRPSSRVAVDALLYWATMAGKLHGREIRDNNNIYCAIRTLSEEHRNE